MKKLAIFCLAAMLLALPACGPDDESHPGAGARQEASASAPEPEETPAPTEEPESVRGGYDPTVSSPAFADHDMLLEDVWSFGQDVPEEIWWPNEDRVREVFAIDPESRDAASCSDGLLEFYFRISYDEEALTARHGLTVEALHGKNGTDWWIAFEQLKLYVTLRPVEGDCPVPETWQEREPGEWDGMDFQPLPIIIQEEGVTPPPDLPVPELTDCPMAWAPVEGYAGFEQTDSTVDESGQAVRMRLRWRLGEHWAMAELPAHSLERFLEKEPELWSKVDMRGAGQEPQTETGGAVASVLGEDE